MHANRPTRPILFVLFALIVLPGLLACGQKGPLKLPPDTPKIAAKAGAQ